MALTPEERAEKICRDLVTEGTYPKVGWVKIIAAKIREAEKEAEERGFIKDVRWKAEELCSAERRGRASALEEAAKLAHDFVWVLPTYTTECCNNASDDAACSVSEQIAKRVRAIVVEGRHD